MTRSIYHGVREIEQRGKTTWTVGPDGDDGVTVNTVPVTVGLNQEDLEWLIRPLLHRAWQEGFGEGVREASGNAAVDDGANPYTDPPVGVDRDR